MNYYIADFAHQSVICKSNLEGPETITNEISAYENRPFLGPNSLVIQETMGVLYFTDSGAFGDTSL
jgi:hypothetical protein